MRAVLLGALPLLALVAGPALAQPYVNGEADDLLYGYPTLDYVWIPPFGGNLGLGAVQDTETGYGDASYGQPDVANGSELDAAYATIYDNTLYLVLAGNFENNGNKVLIFFDTRDGGQNQMLAGVNPDVDFGALDRLAQQPDPNDPNLPDPNRPGLKFATGFGADFFVGLRVENSDPVNIQVNYAELYDVTNAPTPVGYYVGRGQARCAVAGGALVDGDPNAPVMLVSLDNSNTGGVLGNDPPGVGDGSGVLTGLEVAIPLDAIGNPTGPFEFMAVIVSGGTDNMSNQILGGLFGGPNLGDPAAVDLSTTLHLPMQIDPANVPDAYGACCTGTDCTITLEADCTGTWLENVSCDGNPCDATPAGACCIEGECFLMTEADCLAMSGEYLGDDTDCLGCNCYPDPTGACAVPGQGSSIDCVIITEQECLDLGGIYAGDFTDCSSFGIATPHVAGTVQDPEWQPADNPMTDLGGNIFEATFTGLDPNSRHEFKITDGTWSNTYPGSNSWLFADPNGEITITYDINIYNDGWSPNVQRLGLSHTATTWTAAGSFQGWDNANPATEMLAVTPDIYMYEGTGLDPNATHYWKAVVTGSWDSISWDSRSINTSDMEFEVSAETDKFRLLVNPRVGVVKVCEGGTIGDSNCDGVVDVFDINPFVSALLDGEAVWSASFDCDFMCANDVNGDQVVDVFDINPFVDLLLATP